MRACLRQSAMILVDTCCEEYVVDLQIAPESHPLTLLTRMIASRLKDDRHRGEKSWIHTLGRLVVLLLFVLA